MSVLSHAYAASWMDALSQKVDSLLRDTGLKEAYHWETDKAAAPVQSARTIIDDMGKSNDAELLGVKPHAWAVHETPAQVAMGTDTRGCKAPTWWQESQALAKHKKCDAWQAFVQWFVVFEGAGNSANNLRVQVRYPQSWFLSQREDRWMPLVRTRKTGWFLATKDDVTWIDQSMDIQQAPDGSLAFAVTKATPYVYHGIAGEGPVDIGHAVDDMAAVFTTVQARLVLDDPDGPDEREQAVWLLQSGADYYPRADTHAKEAIPPGVGLSRSKRLTAQWQTFNFATLANARQDYPGPSRSLSIEAFLAKPPPLE
ncbi:MAG: hypothetical protein AB8C46_14320 [Burkholderiaceae bacterium]